MKHYIESFEVSEVKNCRRIQQLNVSSIPNVVTLQNLTTKLTKFPNLTHVLFRIRMHKPQAGLFQLNYHHRKLEVLTLCFRTAPKELEFVVNVEECPKLTSLIIETNDSSLKNVKVCASKNLVVTFRSAEHTEPISEVKLPTFGHVWTAGVRSLHFRGFDLQNTWISTEDSINYLDFLYCKMQEPITVEEEKYPRCSLFRGNAVETVKQVTLNECSMTTLQLSNLPNLKRVSTPWGCVVDELVITNCPNLEQCLTINLAPRHGACFRQLPQLQQLDLKRLNTNQVRVEQVPNLKSLTWFSCFEKFLSTNIN